MKIFRRSPPNREIEFTWHRERGGAGEKGGPSLATVFKYYYCSPYRSRSFPTRNTFPRHLPSIGSSVLVYLSRKRTRSGIRLRPDYNAGKDIPGVTRFEAPEINRPRSFSF